ncbi:CoA ester lyase [Psychrobacillus sp. OK032]|uniref:HpcH/HpaI aldolase/citrate lyase family protein n=1 Tax=Psychrobacillus sp. OK032 TaxID=1884358 RepID=UPI0008D3E36B|nr:CoA ester lyase [Psychrobacillus sp. OK032]SES26031.1 citrate lyase subunit beta / citryl-CoA lyase [Psychrobacillus sp. OK032]
MGKSTTWMFIPGSDEKKLSKAVSINADVYIYDLEDAVANTEKKEARKKVISHIQNHPTLNNYIRINAMPSPYMYDDLMEVIIPGVKGIVLPKAETKEEIQFVSKIIEEKEKEYDIAIGEIHLIPLIESALGVHNAFNIASSSKRVRSLAFGSIDFTLDIKGEITSNGLELLFARSQLVIASRAARIESPIDTVFSDFRDSEGLTRETRLIKELGFQGKLVIHPSQISIVNNVFRPTQTEIEKAQQIVTAYEEYKKAGKGVFELDGKMVDLPVVEQARKIIERSQY